MMARTQNCDNASKNLAEEPYDRTSFRMAGIGTNRTYRDVCYLAAFGAERTPPWCGFKDGNLEL
jgi:hypothetical protein